MKFLGKWIIAISLAWPAGGILAIILSYLVVNMFYHEETNAIVGLCIGGAVGFAQWLIFRYHSRMSIWWIFASALGMGIPWGVFILLEETGTVFPELFNNVYSSWLISGFAGGLLIGLFQWPLLKKISVNPVYWVMISTLAWGFAIMPNQVIPEFGLIIGGVVLGIITGLSLIWLRKDVLKPTE